MIASTWRPVSSRHRQFSFAVEDRVMAGPGSSCPCSSIQMRTSVRCRHRGLRSRRRASDRRAASSSRSQAPYTVSPSIALQPRCSAVRAEVTVMVNSAVLALLVAQAQVIGVADRCRPTGCTKVGLRTGVTFTSMSVPQEQRHDQSDADRRPTARCKGWCAAGRHGSRPISAPGPRVRAPRRSAPDSRSGRAACRSCPSRRCRRRCTAPQVMQASCWPLRMSMPIGQTLTQAMQSMQSPLPSDRLLAARLAAPVAIADGQRVLVHHRGLNARPGAGIDADLLAREAAEDRRSCSVRISIVI